MWKVAARASCRSRGVQGQCRLTYFKGQLITYISSHCYKQQEDSRPCITLLNSGFMATDETSGSTSGPGSRRTDTERGEASSESGSRPLTKEDIPEMVKAVVDQLKPTLGGTVTETPGKNLGKGIRIAGPFNWLQRWYSSRDWSQL